MRAIRKVLLPVNSKICVLESLPASYGTAARLGSIVSQWLRGFRQEPTGGWGIVRAG
jgi:hypothetical protein